MGFEILEQGSVKQGYKIFYCTDGIKHLSEASMTMLKPDIWFFNRLLVSPETRGIGIGTVLTNKAVDFCKENNVSLICGVNPYNTMTVWIRRG